ncbi:VOC family protein [Thiobacillus sp.]|uniref:VOC family protein n=1 Tax=Thiobacillus sp. TaxID=924 RepID=UPI0025CC6F55|nr:VOC family protein [Thiobacillus sp.]
MPMITPFLWFDGQAEAAAAFYVSVFPDSAIHHVSRYSEAGREQHGQTPGTVMTVAFELDGQPFTALNGGPVFQFSPAVSFVIHCKTQAEIDHYWEKLGAGGAPEAQQCGWLADRFGLSWQIVPDRLVELLTGPDAAAAGRVMEAMMRMKKIDIAALERAAEA